jgi:triphosphatase
MEVEIELKFIFNAAFAEDLYTTLDKFHCISSKKQFLHNVYFDTAERRLRKFDMGLRVRSCDGKSVQTIKTAGRVIGGLHQRPEYNEPIEGLRPELACFNNKIWPKNCDIKQLEQSLTPIFSTDFERKTWLIEIAGDTLIEVAYDVGFIETNQGKMPLCEVELELVKGDEKQLFTLGHEIAQLTGARLGNVSKAQRGYMLADNATFEIKPLDHPKVSVDMSIQQTLLINMQHGLKQIQYHENCYLENKQTETLQELLKGVKFLHQNIIIFKSEIDGLSKAPWIEDLHWLARSFSWLDEHFTQVRLLEDKAYYLRKLPKYKTIITTLKRQQNSLPNTQSITSLLTSSRYCQFILTFTQWLIVLEKNTFSGEKNNNIIQFANEHLDKAWAQISIGLKNSDTFSMQQFLSYQGLLESNLLIGLSLGGIFSEQKSEQFNSLWSDIKQGLNEFSMINLISEIALDETDSALQYEYLKWVKRKQNSLLSALQQSKHQALQKAVYWSSEN